MNVFIIHSLSQISLFNSLINNHKIYPELVFFGQNKDLYKNSFNCKTIYFDGNLRFKKNKFLFIRSYFKFKKLVNKNLNNKCSFFIHTDKSLLDQIIISDFDIISYVDEGLGTYSVFDKRKEFYKNLFNFFFKYIFRINFEYNYRLSRSSKIKNLFLRFPNLYEKDNRNINVIKFVNYLPKPKIILESNSVVFFGQNLSKEFSPHFKFYAKTIKELLYKNIKVYYKKHYLEDSSSFLKSFSDSNLDVIELPFYHYDYKSVLHIYTFSSSVILDLKEHYPSTEVIMLLSKKEIDLNKNFIKMVNHVIYL